jgi:hypothetical protein
MEFYLEANLDFSLNMFTLTFIHLVHLSIGGPSCMVFEHLQNLFDLKDLVNDISQLFFICFYVVPTCIFGNITWAFGVMRLLTLAKPFGDI